MMTRASVSEAVPSKSCVYVKPLPEAARREFLIDIMQTLPDLQHPLGWIVRLGHGTYWTLRLDSR